MLPTPDALCKDKMLGWIYRMAAARSTVAKRGEKRKKKKKEQTLKRRDNTKPHKEIPMHIIHAPCGNLEVSKTA